jgi:hypothetical protein
MKSIFFLFLLFSGTIIFAINPPTNTAPSNAVTNQPTSLTIDWSTVSGNLGYIYEIDTTAAFNSSWHATGTTGTTSSQKNLSSLYFGTTYYWRVATIGPVDTSVWSATTSFTTTDTPTNTAPANAATNQHSTTLINWAAMSGNLGYLYELDTVLGFNSPAFVAGIASTNSSQSNLYDLRFGTTYYWKVAIKNTLDTSGWGATWSFTTRDEVINTSPSNGAVNQNTNVTINWDITAGNEGYLYELDTTPNFNSSTYISGATSTNNSQHTATNLKFTTTYYWRAAVKNNIDTSGWGPTWSFTTLSTISNTAPSNGASNQNTSVTTNWSSMSGNTGYLYELDTTPNFNSALFLSGTTITNSSQMNLSDLWFGTTYYWRAAVRNSTDTSGWGSTWSFTTRDGINNFSPNNVSNNQATTLTLDWSSMTGNTGYLYELDTTPNFNSSLYVGNSTSTNISQVLISDLYFGTIYYWRAAVKNNIDTSSWSTTYSFRTTDGVLNLSPSNAATTASINPALDWTSSGGNTGYLYEIDTVPSFGSSLYQVGLTPVNNSQQNLSNLLYGTTYYWRVAITNNVDTSQWSTMSYFTTVFQITGIPLLISPPDLSTAIPIAPLLLTWDSIAVVTSYQIQYSTDNTFSTNVNTSTSLLLNTTIVGLSNSTTYYWRVRGSDGLGFSPWSIIWSFDTEFINLMTALSEEGEFNIYPNPVRDVLTIELPNSQASIISVIDAKGQVIDQQVYSPRTAIYYNTDKLFTGMYFLTIASEGKRRTLKFTVR